MTTQLKRIKYEVIFEALEGEFVCGDNYLVKEFPEFILIAVVDGLGHGTEAAFAAKKAIETIEANVNKSIESLIDICNQALLETRGAAITITRIDAAYELTYLEVGNVMGVCWKFTENGKLKKYSFFSEGGIVGARLPEITSTKKIQMAAGDTLIFATDGIKTQFETEPPKLGSPEDIAKQIFNTYRNKKDDGLILVAQLL